MTETEDEMLPTCLLIKVSKVEPRDWQLVLVCEMSVIVRPGGETSVAITTGVLLHTGMQGAGASTTEVLE